MRAHVIALSLMLLATVLSGCLHSDDDEQHDFHGKEYDPASKAPDFTLKTVDGRLFKLSENKGKVILLNFWGTWCGPCRREIPDFNKLHKKYRKNGLEIVGITLKRGS